MSPFALFCYFDYIVVVNTLEGAVTEHFVNTNEQSDKYIDDHRYLGHDQSRSIPTKKDLHPYVTSIIYDE